MMSDNNSRGASDLRAVPGLWLLVSLLLSLTVVPIAQGLGPDRVVLRTAMTVTIITAIIAVWRRDVLRISILVLGVVAVPIAWAALFVDSPTLFIAHCLAFSTFFWVVGGVILAVAIRERFATVDAVFDAISSYLLFGLGWAFTYLALFVASPVAFSWPDSMAKTAEPITMFPKVVYYSMVTMSTLGYGDITPTSNVACTLAWMQSVTGQFYVAVLVAWLVSALPRPDAGPGESGQVMKPT